MIVIIKRYFSEKERVVPTECVPKKELFHYKVELLMLRGQWTTDDV